MYHYTYLIQHKTKDKRYIGVRSSKCLPIQDTNYWGSSNYLPKDIKSDHVKIILKTFNTRADAINHEIALHNLNNVAVNPIYYNKAKQTSIGFDTTGTSIPDERKKRIQKTLQGRVHSKEWNAKVSKALKGREVSSITREKLSKIHKKLASLPGYKNPRKGIKVSDKTKEKWKKATSHIDTSGYKNNKFYPWFIYYVDTGYCDVFYHTTKTEFALQKGINPASFRNTVKTSKSRIILPNRFNLGKTVMGNIKDISALGLIPIPKKAYAPWFITHKTYSEIFYYTTSTEYAKKHNINSNIVLDAIHASKGKVPIKRGYFKNKIVGRIPKIKI